MTAACQISNGSTVRNIADRMKHLFMVGDDVTLIVPVAHFLNGTQSRHWGAVLIKKEHVYWGDSLKCAPFANILDTVMKLMKNIFPGKNWIRSDKNYIIDFLKYKPQTNAYSCGFYVVSAICHFAESTGCISPFEFGAAKNI